MTSGVCDDYIDELDKLLSSQEVIEATEAINNEGEGCLLGGSDIMPLALLPPPPSEVLFYIL